MIPASSCFQVKTSSVVPEQHSAVSLRRKASFRQLVALTERIYLFKSSGPPTPPSARRVRADAISSALMEPREKVSVRVVVWQQLLVPHAQR